MLMERKMGTSGRKEQKVQRLLPCVMAEITRTPEQDLLDEASRNYIWGEPTVAKIYRESFNSVDCFDAARYGIQNEHKMYNWRSKFAWSLLMLQMTNAYNTHALLNTEKKQLSKPDFLKRIALSWIRSARSPK